VPLAAAKSYAYVRLQADLAGLDDFVIPERRRWRGESFENHHLYRIREHVRDVVNNVVYIGASLTFALQLGAND